MKIMRKTKQRLTMIETDYKHIETNLDKLIDKVDSLQKNFYIGMGIFVAIQLLLSSGIIKVG